MAEATPSPALAMKRRVDSGPISAGNPVAASASLFA